MRHPPAALLIVLLSAMPGAAPLLPAQSRHAFIIEFHPILPFVFFDAGSAVIPERYQLFTNPSETASFSDSIRSDDVSKTYYHLLNILGYRMRMHPTTKIEVGGSNSAQPGIGENIAAAKARAETVTRYLMEIWRIDPARITIRTPSSYPDSRSAVRDSLSLIEQRCCEIITTDWDLIKPVIVRGHRPSDSLAFVHSYTLIRFKFDSPDPGDLNNIILREYFYPDVSHYLNPDLEMQRTTAVEIVGHNDVVGLEDRNFKLTRIRAEAIETLVRRNVREIHRATITTRWTGEHEPLFTNALPEGRMLNRCVRVTVTASSR